MVAAIAAASIIEYVQYVVGYPDGAVIAVPIRQYDNQLWPHIADKEGIFDIVSIISRVL